MKKSSKFLLLIALLSIIIGTSAILWGKHNGALDDIEKATAAQKVNQEISSFKQLELDLSTRNLTIQPSEDNKWHLTYYKDNKLLGDIKVTQNSNRLSLKQIERDRVINGPIAALGQYLNNRKQNTQDVILSVPEGAQFDSLKGYVSESSYLYTFPIKEINLTGGAIYTDDVTIEKANLSANALYLDNSSFQELHSEDYSYLSLTNSNIKNGTLNGEDMATLELDKSLLQNTSLLNDNGSITLTNTELDNVTLSGEGNDLTAKSLALKNLVEIKQNYSDITLYLANDNRSTTNFNFKVTDDDLDVSDGVAGTNKVIRNDDDMTASFTKEVKDNKATLNITNKEGTVSIN